MDELDNILTYSEKVILDDMLVDPVLKNEFVKSIIDSQPIIVTRLSDRKYGVDSLFFQRIKDLLESSKFNISYTILPADDELINYVYELFWYNDEIGKIECKVSKIIEFTSNADEAEFIFYHNGDCKIINKKKDDDQ